MCVGGTISGILTLIIGLAIIVLLTFNMWKKPTIKKRIIIVLDIILLIITVMFYLFFSTMFC